MALPAMGHPLWLLQLPYSRYGIAYDFHTRSLKSAPPDGYGMTSTRGWYGAIINCMGEYNFERDQKSMYAADCGPVLFYTVLRSMRFVEPAGCFSACIQDVLVYMMPLDEMYLTQAFRIGGAECPRPFGPMPLHLDRSHMGVPPQGPPPHPRFTARIHVMRAIDWVV
ncbi:hypothetical protein CALCODRAFT_487724 [Calocera cornea HHB12733]|uniref:Uncharacterized protein n=1 Tax=Calocera cornea HHB12733 TaxID=1353952 RepID=A0A165CZ17_9BASI|nr:hypothetical protein CALCODRAFT_488788 [Calocera cornea HHB12733]KZT51711.1 hypothetical protein CALCODRAFT_487724 [Calocera cornea HHB12733]